MGFPLCHKWLFHLFFFVLLGAIICSRVCGAKRIGALKKIVATIRDSIVSRVPARSLRKIQRQRSIYWHFLDQTSTTDWCACVRVCVSTFFPCHFYHQLLILWFECNHVEMNKQYNHCAWFHYRQWNENSNRTHEDFAIEFPYQRAQSLSMH